MRQVCPECGAVIAGAGRCAADGAQAVAADDPLLGSTVGPYRFARLLGAGGMGRVYLAVHSGIGARVAIKVLASERAGDAESVQRFFDEARAASLASHERIVRVHDTLRAADGTPCLVMEYLEGASLAAIVEQGAVPAAEIVPLAVEVLEALATAHAAGVVHRDLKPENVFVSRSGHAKLLDFGIAKLARPEGSGPTRTGAVIGTPAYASPEQIREAKDVDARSDLYSLGVLLYEALSGRLPFETSSLFELMRMHLEAVPPPLASRAPGVPAALEAVVLRALAKDPGARFASARAMEEGLRAVAAGLPRATLADRVARVEAGPRTVRLPRHRVAPDAPTLTPADLVVVPAPHDAAPVGATAPVAAASPPSSRAGRSSVVVTAIVALALAAGLVGVGALLVFVLQVTRARDALPAATVTVSPAGSYGPGTEVVGAAAFDVTHWLPELQRAAAAHASDPKLVSISAIGVQANGLIDTRKDGGAVTVTFIGARASPSDTLVRVYVTRGAMSADVTDAPSGTRLAAWPKCTIGRLVKVAGVEVPPPYVVAYGGGSGVGEGWRISGARALTDAECVERLPRSPPAP